MVKTQQVFRIDLGVSVALYTKTETSQSLREPSNPPNPKKSSRNLKLFTRFFFFIHLLLPSPSSIHHFLSFILFFYLKPVHFCHSMDRSWSLCPHYIRKFQKILIFKLGHQNISTTMMVGKLVFCKVL